MQNFDLKKFLIENVGTITSRALLEVSIEVLQQQFVDSGKITQDIFDEIVDTSNNQSAYATWLTSRVAGTKKMKPIIKKEDIYKFKEYFDIFNRNKGSYPTKDINQIKDAGTLNKFIQITMDIKEKEEKDVTAKKGVSKSEKFEDLKVGDVGGYSIYGIPKGRMDLYKASCELGSGTGWCTATGKSDSYYTDYIKKGPLWIIINNSNPKEKYQFSYETSSFMDKNDVSIFEDYE